VKGRAHARPHHRQGYERQEPMMTVIQNSDGGWDVVSGGNVVASFRTIAEAWRYIDRSECALISKSEQRSDYRWQKRIRPMSDPVIDLAEDRRARQEAHWQRLADRFRM
jgi:hypothetical protein